MNRVREKIADFHTRTKRMPTVRELMALAGYKSTGATAYLIRQLVEGGFLAKDQATGRLVPGPAFGEGGVKVLGLVEAGFPSPAEEELRDTMNFDEYLTPNKEASYILKVKGDSMKDAGVVEGDMVIVERRQSYKPGQIVIAMIDGAYTMKYLRKDSDGFYLEPANEKYPLIRPMQSMKIEAVVTAVVRKYRA
ncbi:repressor LexA [Candidatus Kaiserbacteria bacterium]|nr:repressor LexA [Candidatus Kaiserbacteria bacterium]